MWYTPSILDTVGIIRSGYKIIFSLALQEQKMLEQCEPKSVWKYFEEFCSIPHPSGFEKQAADYIVSCADTLGLEAVTDTVGNVLIRKKAQGKPPDSEGVILQSHLDMVPQKNDTTDHDFRKDPISPFIDGDWVKASGTTLGADNGIGVAIALAVLENKRIAHGPIEALFTLDEERGMTGAFGLPSDFLQFRKMINLDTENDEEICIGCAGGTDIIGSFPMEREIIPAGYIGLSISIKGLQGGHSGMEIHLGRGNALKEMGDLLNIIMQQTSIRLSSINGGTACNAIPREAFATLAVPEDTVTDIQAIINDFYKERLDHFKTIDPEYAILVEQCTAPEQALGRSVCNSLLIIMNNLPNGVRSMSSTLTDVVETSNNLAIVKEKKGALLIECMSRSSSDSDLATLKGEITDLFRRNNATVSYESTFPGWQPDPKSSLLTTMKNAYHSVNKKEPMVTVVHAGLECGVIGARFSGMEMISCGPTIHFAHSPDERMSIASVEKFWKFIVTGLELL